MDYHGDVSIGDLTPLRQIIDNQDVTLFYFLDNPPGIQFE
jgi:hypothetical protein